MHTYYSAATKFPYLVSKKRKEGEELRRVAQFEWRVIERSVNARFEAFGLTFTPLPVCASSKVISSPFSEFRAVISVWCIMPTILDNPLQQCGQL